MVAKFWRNFSYRSAPEGRPWVVGVSGGADSLCLLHLLHTQGFELVAAHFNHLLRPLAAADAENVAFVAGRLGIPCVLGQGDVRAEAQRTGQTIEAAARALRYAFLFDQARQKNAWCVAVAHTADDQVETILLHLLRGSGSAGLQGMPQLWLPNPWSPEIALLRPLLNVSKNDTLTYCAEYGLQPVIDETNLDTAYTRNRLRHELLPALESFNPAARQAVLRLSEVVRGEQEVLQALVAKAWAGCLRIQGTRFVALNAVQAAGELPGLRRLLARQAFGLLRPGLLDVDFETVERFSTWLADAAWREGELMWLAAWEADLPAVDWPQTTPTPARLEQSLLPGQLYSIDLSAKWRLTYQLLADPIVSYQQAMDNHDPYQAWLDLERIALPLSIRPRWPGARFQPLGLHGHSKKISDLMVDAQIPKRARQAWPLLCAGEEILWAPGLAAGHIAHLSADTRQVLWVGLSSIK